MHQVSSLHMVPDSAGIVCSSKIISYTTYIISSALRNSSWFHPLNYTSKYSFGMEFNKERTGEHGGIDWYHAALC